MVVMEVNLINQIKLIINSRSPFLTDICLRNDLNFGKWPSGKMRST